LFDIACYIKDSSNLNITKWRPFINLITKNSMSKSKTFKLGRDSRNGQFIPVKEAERRPNTTTVERVPKSGYGDTDSKKRK
jgi:hypothetical protein